MLLFWIPLLAFCVPYFISGIRKKRWTRVILTGAPIALFVLIICNFIYHSLMASSPQWVYKQAFGEYPSLDVKIIESDYNFGWDYITFTLKFKTKDLNKILASYTKLEPVTKEEFEKRGYAHSELDWFKPLENLHSMLYAGPSNGDMHNLSKVSLSYDSESKIAYFSFDELY